VPASLLMANLQAFLKAICRQEFKLDEATGIINDLVSENTLGENFITFFWGILNQENNTLTYVNAGHNPPLLVRDGRIIKLTIGGMILGVMKTLTPYSSQIVQLETGDALILFTDGVTEAMNMKREEFTDERLEQLVSRIYSLNAEEIIKNIRAELQDHVDGANQSDDITLLTLKVR
jgi:phosphoserine phosphatase RsbU/P